MLIWYFRGNKKAKDALSSVPYDSRLISSLCIMELIQGCRDKQEIKTIKEFIKTNISLTLPPDETICEKALLLLERYAASDGLRTVDAVIAASALLNNATLATSNFKHFKNISNLSTLRFLPSVADN